MDKTTLESEFEKDSNKIFKQNVKEYTSNDKDFLSKLAELYGNALSAKGLNVVDPVYANMFHYNKLQFRGNLDLPRVSRTYVFFTRPELNFSFENINAIPFFKWLYNKRIGKMIMAMLTDPDYFINAPGALNSLSQLSYSEINDILKDYKSMTQKNEKKISSLIAGADSTEFKDFVSNDNTENYASLLAASVSASCPLVFAHKHSFLPPIASRLSLHFASLQFKLLKINKEKGQLFFSLPYAGTTRIRSMGMISARHIRAPLS